MKYSLRFWVQKNRVLKSIKLILEEKDCPLILNIAYDNKKIRYYTGKHCDFKHWDAKTQQLLKNCVLPDKESHYSFNKDLLSIMVKVGQIFEFYNSQKVIPTSYQILNLLKVNKENEIIEFESPKLKGFFDYFKKYIEDSVVSEGRKKHLNTTYNKLFEYCPETTFEQVDLQYLTDFRKWLLEEKKVSKNTVSCEMRRFRSFFVYAKTFKWTSNNPFNDFKNEGEVYGDPIYLSKIERNKLNSTEIKNERLAHVRDMFILQSFIGCRVEDFVSLKRNSITSKNTIEYIPGKTAHNSPRTISVPLMPNALSIIARYNEPNGDLIRFISREKYNKYLKELFELEEINLVRIVTALDPKTRKNIRVRLCDIASSHMARRNFVGILVESGADMETICSLSGHSKGSKSIARYFNVVESAKSKAMYLLI